MNASAGGVETSDEVATALRDQRPIVALESTIIAHGMPWPANVETALAVEAEVRTLGAVPATVAVIDGRPKAGLSADDIERIGRGGTAIAKLSRRDLPIAVASSSRTSTGSRLLRA